MRNNKGSTLIIFVLSLTVILGFTALVVDFGRVMLEKTKLQNALEASVLAAAQDLPDTSQASSVNPSGRQLQSLERTASARLKKQ